ncbi:glycosyltransferase family 39 protein [Nakamurella endophytica]|uniref:Membrane protein n=1 Tax=Nakamurella endophytica TaxID=1748367 RepID=A0A917WAF7_9ACTN|nr:glycosyltransferase family 39 protein [Nakamurella endophytica]GGL87383.1 membrane protein [Nakamurella endophytica]
MSQSGRPQGTAGRSAGSARPTGVRTAARGEGEPDLRARPARWYGWAVGAFGTLVALLWSWHPSLWTDESASISAAGRSVGDLWRMVHTVDVVHGCYYLFLHYWTEMFGRSAFAIRLPSAVLVGVAAGLTVVVAQRLADTRVAVSAGVVVALLPRITWAGMEARPYAATVALAAAATAVLLRATSRPSVTVWVGYSVLLAAGCYLNVYVALLGVAHLCSVVLDRRVTAQARRAWLASAVGAAVLSAPLLWVALGQTGQLGSAVRGPFDWLRNVVVNQWFLGDTPTTTTGRDVTVLRLGDVGSWWAPAAVVLAIAGWSTVAFGVVRAAVRHRSVWTWVRDRPFAWAVPWALVPTVVVVGYSVVGSPVYSPRYLTFAAPAVALLIATGLDAVARNYRWVVALVLLVATVPVYVSQRHLYAKNGSDWVSVAGVVHAGRQAGDCIYYTPRYPGAAGLIGQTTRGIAVAYPRDFAGLLDLTLLRTPAAAGNLTGVSRPLSDAATDIARCPRVWVVERNDYPQPFAAADETLLERSGLAGRLLWRGPLDSVLLFRRG